MSNFDQMLLKNAGTRDGRGCPLSRLIISHESGTFQGSPYSISNFRRKDGTFGLSSLDVSKILVEEVLAAQRAGSIFATGAYQFINSTLSQLYRLIGEKGLTFNSAVQDLGFVYILLYKRRNVANFLFSQNNVSVERCVLDLAREWASLPRDSSNLSYYTNGVDKAYTDYVEVVRILEEARKILTNNYRVFPKVFSENRIRALLLYAYIRQLDPNTFLSEVSKEPDLKYATHGPNGAFRAGHWLSRVLDDSAHGYIVYKYGYNRHNTTNRPYISSGLVVGSLPGQPVHAGVRGVVKRNGYQEGGLGIYVDVLTTSGYSVLFSRLGKNNIVRVGESVTPESIIGYTGMTGAVEQTGIKIEVHLGRKTFDPESIRFT